MRAKTPKQIKDFVTKQLRFASSIAINRLLREIEASQQRHAGQTFKLRRDFLNRQWRVVKSTKAKLEGTLGLTQKAYFMENQETGKPKRPRKGRLAIPTVAPAQRPDLRISQRPRALLKAKAKSSRFFLGVSRKGKTILFEKIGTPRKRLRKRAGKRGPVLPKYPIAARFVLQGESQINPKWHSQEFANDIAQRRFQGLFEQAFAEALRTAK